MSWKEASENKLTIITGDGSRFEPLWKPTSKTLEFNVVEFNFSEVEGTLVQRRKAKGRRFPLELYFQGENHLQLTESFETASKDSRAWNIIHPYYGSIFVQPLSIAFSNDAFNVTRLDIEVVETILDDAPKTTTDAASVIKEQANELNQSTSQAFENNVDDNSATQAQLTGNNEDAYNEASDKITGQQDSEDYFNLFNEANSKVVSATSTPLQKIAAINNFLSAPANLIQSSSATAQSRINLFQGQLTQLRSNVAFYTTPSQKRVFEIYGTGYLSGMLISSITPLPGNYSRRSEVVNVIETILSNFNAFIQDIDSLQTLTGDKTNSYIPNPDVLSGLSAMVNFTVANLFNIASNAKQERFHILEDDSNPILLTHRFIGLDVNDENLNQFLELNNIGGKEFIEIEKGRTITYLV